jgi:phage RecT family recombinase
MNNLKTVKNLEVVDSFKKTHNLKRLQQALPKHINIEEFTSNLFLEIYNNKLLQKCSFTSLLKVAIDAANFGLIPNSKRGHVWLIPYNIYDKVSKTYIYEAQLQIGYKGYIKKLYDNGIIIESEIVTNEEIEKDRFEEVRGSNSSIMHKPIRKGIRTKEQIALAYAVAHINDKQKIIEVMSLEEIEESAKTDFFNTEKNKKERILRGVWCSKRLTDYIEMLKKTTIKRVAKRCPIDIAQKMVNYEIEQENKIIDTTFQPKRRDSIDINNLFEFKN